jgi:hypothetical protein
MNKARSRAYDSLAHVAVVAIAVMMSLQIHQWGRAARETALEDYRKVKEEETRLVAERIEHAIDEVHRGIAMIAAVPSVRDPLPSGVLGGDAGYVIGYAFDQILRPASVARLYVASADPHRSAPIVVRAFTAAGRRGTAGLRPIPTVGDEETALIVAQIERLRRTPAIAGTSAAELPMVSGREVALAEDTAERSERDTRAVVFSVPIVDTDGRIAGAVSAAVRHGDLRRLLPKTDHALIDVGGGTVVTSPNGVSDADAMATATPVPDLPFSTVRRLASHDGSTWQLWVTRPEFDFYYGADHLRAALAEVAALVSIWVVAGGAMVVVSSRRRRRSRLREEAEFLAQRVESLLRRERPGAP